jgi:4-hydroxythreonine-4-phosphate dehydrogenase
LDERPLVVLVDQDLMRQRAQQLGIEVELIEYHGQPNSCEKGQLYIEHVALHVPVIAGELNFQNAAYVIEQLRVRLICHVGEKCRCCNCTCTKVSHQ